MLFLFSVFCVLGGFVLFILRGGGGDASSELLLCWWASCFASHMYEWIPESLFGTMYAWVLSMICLSGCGCCCCCSWHPVSCLELNVHEEDRDVYVCTCCLNVHEKARKWVCVYLPPACAWESYRWVCAYSLLECAWESYRWVCVYLLLFAMSSWCQQLLLLSRPHMISLQLPVFFFFFSFLFSLVVLMQIGVCWAGRVMKM